MPRGTGRAARAGGSDSNPAVAGCPGAWVGDRRALSPAHIRANPQIPEPESSQE
jgi:hypothetical protein